MLEPANTVIEKCGGVKRVADITKRSEVRVRRWGYPREKGGTDGVIPANVAQDLMSWSRANGDVLIADDFFPPAKPLGTSAPEGTA